MTPEPWTSILGGVGAAAWPLVASLAVVVVGSRAREAKRTRRLNELLHELRRPLQTMSLDRPLRSADRTEPIELAIAALADLDHHVNGGAVDFRRRPVEARMLAIAACERWRAGADRAGRRITVRWRCADALADVDPVRVSQALDNLIANAIEHGGGPITIEGLRRGSRIDLIVRDSGGVGRARRDSSPRRGHGLRLTRRLARANGGELRMQTRGARGTSAALMLPVASGSGPRTG